MNCLQNNVMVDIETLGTDIGSVIVTIGACGIGTDGNYHDFYARLSMSESIGLGFKTNGSTIKWWLEQEDAARQELINGDTKDVVSALKGFATWLGRNFDADFRIWCNGASFDFPMLKAYFLKFDMNVPWKYWNERDLRTMKGICPAIKNFKFDGTKHSALDDAKNQFEQLHLIMKTIAA